MASNESQEVEIQKTQEENLQEMEISAEINELLIVQLMDKETLEKLWKNLCKEPTIRKTEKRLKSFEDKTAVLWSSIKERHEVLQKSSELKLHPYVVENYYQFAGDIVKRISIRLEKDRKDLVKCEGDDNKLIQNRSLKLVLLKRYIELNATVDEDEPTESELSEVIETIERLHSEYNQAQRLIPSECARFSEFVQESEMIAADVLEFMNRLTTIKGRGGQGVSSKVVQINTSNDDQKDIINNHQFDAQQFFNLLKNAFENKNHSQGQSGHVQGIRLPKLEIPYFDGTTKKWLYFKAAYEASIHCNPDLNSVLKMRYLQTYVTGSAAGVICHLELSEKNYTTAWNLLLARYHNMKLLIDDLIERFLGLPSVEVESSEKLKSLIDGAKEIIYSLQNLGETPWNAMIIHVICSKLPAETLSLWEQSCGKGIKIAEFQALDEFLENRIRTLHTLEAKGRTLINKPIESSHSGYYPTPGSNVGQCEFCAGDHLLHRCIGFGNKSPQERLHFVHANQLCQICLNHHESACKFKWTCRICKGKHNSLLHIPDNKSLSNSAIGAGKVVLLSTAKVMLISRHGIPFHFKALIDGGSMVSFVSEKLMNTLKWKRSADQTTISGVMEQLSKSRGTTTFNLKSIYDSTATFTVSACILPKLTKCLPTLDSDGLPEFRSLELADPEYFRGGQIDMILGADAIKDLMLTEVVNGRLLAQKTHLGWILSGPYKVTKSPPLSCVVSVNCANEESYLKKFWETEEKVTEHPDMSAEETACELFYQTTTRVGEDGRYVCRLPFKQNAELGKSRNAAVANLLQLEKKFRRNPEFKARYVEAMQEYFSLGHARQATPLCPGDQHYYIPHLAVIKETSLTTKTRVVYNASCPSSNKRSLNDVLMVGPTIQKDLVEKINLFRFDQMVFTNDIVKMYRQINIDPKDWKFQRFVWRFCDTDSIQEFCLTTVTFGTASAPFTAIRTIMQLAIDVKESYPIAAEILTNYTYVDDIHYGTDSIEKAIKGRDELIAALGSASFEVRKWASNDPRILDGLPLSHVDTAEVHKFLGLLWNSKTDTLEVNKFEFEHIGSRMTHRLMCAEVGKLFDPFGQIQPLIVPAKILLQDLWKEKLAWDQPVPEALQKRWEEIAQSFHDLSFFKIPRWNNPSKATQVELHGFADASKLAYGAVIYAKFGVLSPTISFVLAKSRVAPCKHVSIPRLELKAALLLSDLMKKVIEIFKTAKFSPVVYGWSDAKVALSWIRASPEKWKDFVRNRVATIHEVIAPSNWNYVPTSDNPADIISRGCDAATLKSSSFWLNGPEWLKDIDMKELSPQNERLEEDDLNNIAKEEHKTVVASAATISEPTLLSKLSTKYSNFSKSCRILAWVVRFINCCRKGEVRSEFVTIHEIRGAEVRFIVDLQTTHFERERQSLSFGKFVHKQSLLRNLNPFVDNQGALRVGGRIQRASLPYNHRHPYILPEHGEMVDLIINEFHKYALHGGVQVTINSLRKKYWILHATKVTTALLKRCISCFRASPRNQPQIMGILPGPRVNFSKAFLHSGVDFAGPFRFRISTGRGQRTTKGYIAVFVCLATKAIHLEVVSSLTTEAFIAALTRFLSRRGPVSHLYSDNATNFVGAFRKLSKVGEQLSAKNIEWSFIPPRAPHFGGLWEAGVKSLKTHLKRSFGDRSFTFEEMSTILCQIEGCLNARPLCPLTDDLESLDALTPQHFLTGHALLPLPELDYSLSREGLLTRWELLKKLYQEVCLRYKEEYLSRLQQRPKWCTPNPNLHVGQLVLVAEDGVNSLSWPLARITDTHPGSDGHVRVVTVKSRDGSKKRPITKVYPLPVYSSPSDVDS